MGTHNQDGDTKMRPQLVITAVLRLVARRIFKVGDLPPPVDWRRTAEEIWSRIFVGLMIGAGLCIALFPVLFWPGRRLHRSLFEQWGQPEWISWVFLVLFIAPALVGALSRRVVPGDYRAALFVNESTADLDSRVKTGCMGIVLPLSVLAYGVYRITHPHMISRFTGQVKDPDVVVSIGLMACGIAVIVHAFGFVPYERIPILKYLVVAGGLALFAYGLTWSHHG